MSERSTELTIYDDTNMRILKRYSACLRLDGKSEGTIYQYCRSGKRLADTTGKLFAEMGVYDIRLFLAMEKERGVSPRSLENTRANLSALFQWMVAEEIIPKNPCANINPIKYNSGNPVPFTDVEIDMMRCNCNTTRERALFETLLSSGLRISELISMNVGDVNLETKTIKVRHGKGDKSRTTYINSIAAKYLAEFLVGSADDPVFTNSRGGRITDDGARYVLNAIAKRAGVTNVHPHRFRRTFATNLAARGMEVQTIQKLLGHTNINTTMVYVYTDDSGTQMSYQKYA